MIRKMRTDPFEAPSYVNCLFFSNKMTPVLLPAGDRRFNITEHQPTRMYLTPNELKDLKSGKELEQFADILQRWPIDEVKVTQLIDTETRANIHEATTSINQLIAEAIQKGDLQFFIDRTPSDAESQADFHNRFNPSGMFKSVLDSCIEHATTARPMVVKDEDLFVLFRTLIPDTRYFQDSKTWRKRHYKSLGLDVEKQHRVVGKWDKRERGLLVEWKLPDDLSAPVEKKPKGTVTPIKKKVSK